MSLKIAWIDDEAEDFKYGKKTLEMEGHQVKIIETTHDFLTWLDAATPEQVDIFFLDLMMKIEKEDESRILGPPEARPTEHIDTGEYLYREIRKKFPNKPVVVLTIVRKLPDSIKDDQDLTFELKASTIMPVLAAGIRLLGR